MRKAVSISLGLILLLASAAALTAQTSPADVAVTEAVKRQADTILLRNKLVEARSVEGRGDVVQAAKLYQEAEVLVQQIGSGIDAEKAQTLAGLAATRLQLARQAQSRDDLEGAGIQVNQVLSADPQNAAALAFKKQNDQMIVAMAGSGPAKRDWTKFPKWFLTGRGGNLGSGREGVLRNGQVQRGRDQIGPGHRTGSRQHHRSYYLDLMKQDKIHRDMVHHRTDTQERMERVEKQWILPKNTANLPVPNAYATNTYGFCGTGQGRQAIMAKLDHIHLDKRSFMVCL